MAHSSYLNINNFFKIKPKQFNNVVDSSYLIRSLRKVTGASVLTIENSAGVITTKFSLFGFFTFVIWFSSYFYCLYKIHSEDQTILRKVYDTKLKSYGDEVELITDTIFVVYAMWKVPFDLSGSTEDMQLIVDIDNVIRKLGEEVTYSRYAIALICLGQSCIIATRMFSVWVSLNNLSNYMPHAKVFQKVFTDSLSFIITVQYCGYMLMLRKRYRILNNFLITIKTNTISELIMFPHNRTRMTGKPILVQEKSICKKMKTCGKIYGMLYKASHIVNDKYGFVIILTMLLSLIQIVMYMYYFMEATAMGLFHEFQNYVNFLIYDFWIIGYALVIITFFLYFSETVVNEAKATPHVVHEIINSDSAPTITKEALHLSLQTLHQIPIFTARGLYKLNYVILVEGARSVITFLVILLQFVTN